MPDVDWFLCQDLMCDDTTVIVSPLLSTVSSHFPSILWKQNVKVKRYIAITILSVEANTKSISAFLQELTL